MKKTKKTKEEQKAEKEAFLKMVGRNIKKERRKKGMTQVQLADKCKLNVSTIKRLENGKREMGVITYWTISTVLELSADVLMQP